ncbi:MAG: hypothetical protein IJ468_08810 [Lachnospiraceae bacterium]|nr:hypothetical protein [Lachnospiraceae bacterium]
MLQFIGLFFPAFLSILVYDSITGKEEPSFHVWRYVKLYGAFTILDMTIAMLIIKLMKSDIPFASGIHVSDQFMSVSYLVTVCIVSIFMGYALKVVSSFLKISIKEDDADQGKEEN